MTDPLIVLGPPRSFTSVAGTMLGQHPQLYSVPELHLFGQETVGEFLRACAVATYPMADGVRRTIAELVFGAQSEDAIRRADSWLRRRSDHTTGFLIEVFAERTAPRILVEKSPSTIFQDAFMRRAAEMFPGARYLHLTRHPRGHAQSVLKYLAGRKTQGPLPKDHWLLGMVSYDAGGPAASGAPAVDPQNAWYALHRQICAFLETVPADRQLRVRGESLLSDPDTWVREVASWLGLRTDAEAIDETKHPERSPYAYFGPENAKFGMDFYFLKDPVLRPTRAKPQSLAGPLPWRRDGGGFKPEVIELARSFGYD
ncbi:MAG TPA: sulfotransferase [Xanthomonadales bacterium]|nr:sulfotransferase [Xanthomonadales bacterium]